MNKLRPCYVIRNGKKEKALFHTLDFNSTVIEPSLMIGGHSGGVIAYTMGIVELEDGAIIKVMPENITFIDRIFEGYCWNKNE